MVTIHPTAIVSPAAELGVQVTIGPFALVEPGAQVGDRCELAARATIKEGTRLGPENHVAEGAVIGGLPQHLRAGKTVGTVRVGRGNIIRENVTIHRAFRPTDETVVGDENMLMVNVHIAHDCVIGSRTIIANNVMLAGHVTVEDRAYLSGGVAAHQFCRIGSLAMVGGQSHIVRDVPPFMTVDGESSRIVGINTIGMRRAGFTTEQLQEVKRAYRVMYRSGLAWNEMLHELKQQFRGEPVAHLIAFLEHPGRGITLDRRGSAQPLKLADFRDSEADDQAEDTDEQPPHSAEGRRAAS